MVPTRQLAAIMFTDIVGYTALMGKDSQKALELVRISKDIQKPLVEKHNGKWLKEMGDGALAQFSTALDAVNCSIEIQESARAKLDAKLRIGIHLGDVTVEADDVHGDGVNVASRLESIANPGGIYISESIEKAIKGQTKVLAKYLGEVKLKNVQYGVRTYALQGVGLPVPDIKEGKEISGRFLAELQRRGVIRAGATYVVLLLLLILLVPYAESLIDLPQWSTTALLTVLIVGFPVAIYLAWNYERSPEGFVRTNSQQSWQNPYSASKRKPLTSNFVIAGLVLVILAMYVYPRYLANPAASDGVTIGERSIAVLAFRDLSPGGDQQYFAEGVADEILNSLAGIPGLKVATRASSFPFGNENVDWQEVGVKLRVSTVLEGSIRKQGDQLRVTVQLISAEDGFHIWTGQFDGRGDDVFSIQEDIAQTIADHLKVAFKIDEEPDYKRLTESSEAYDFYLKGLFYLNRRDLTKAEQYFEEAVSVDPKFPLAYAGLAETYFLISMYGIRNPLEVGQMVKKAAEKALSLNNTIAEAYTSLGYYYMFYEWDYAKANSSFQKSVGLNPNHIEDYVAYALYFSWVEQDDEQATRYGKIGIDLDPLNSLAYARHSGILVSLGRYSEGIAAANEAIELYGKSYLAHWQKGLAQIHLGDHVAAIETLRVAQSISNRHHWSVAYEAWAQSAAGNKQAARVLLQELVRRSETEYVGRYTMAIAATALGDLDLAFEFLDEAVSQHEPLLLGIRTPQFPRAVKDYHRYNEILNKIGLNQ